MDGSDLGLDPVVHPLPRLSLCAALAAGPGWVEFAVVRETTGLSDSAVSKHSRALEGGGYVEIKKGAVGRKPRTWLRLTPMGRARLAGHVAALQRLAAPANVQVETS
ncbi:transcriptional regulator [Saccharothrix violaceirubra]|uniref:DNA-binding MarR family transcriptional regulator n=1 Tax=Saccharothrix violaceirubra TaxID=413306 RepID=A0A7W7TB69_9PSEU|nr:transcriptional regulator [Saccharothrix violaceirubra]MBB4969387.1 DNA-binding MarR family transcriptional regulator [Saccharothrix violaceirubra]